MPNEFMRLGLAVGKLDTAAVTRGLDKVSASLKKTSVNSKEFDRALARMAKRFSPVQIASVALAASLAAITAGVAKSIQEFAKYEDQLTTIARISNLSAAEIDDLSDTMKRLATETGIALPTLARFAITGSRFGLSGEGLTDFTETMSRFGLITGNVTDSTLQDFAKLKEITDDTGISYANLANAVTSLGNSFPTTEAAITRSAKRIAQDLSAFDVTTDFVLGIATATEAVGLASERSSTAIGKMVRSLIKVQQTKPDNLQRLAVAAGFTADAFSKMIVNNPVDALFKVIRSGITTQEALQLLGETGTRTAGVFGPLAKNAEVVAKAFDTANKKIRETSALMEQSRKQGQTLWAEFGKLIESSRVLAIEFGEAFEVDTKDMVKGITQALKVMSGTANASTDLERALKDAFNQAVVLGKSFVDIGKGLVGVAKAIGQFKLLNHAITTTIGLLDILKKFTLIGPILEIARLKTEMQALALATNRVNDEAAAQTFSEIEADASDEEAQVKKNQAREEKEIVNQRNEQLRLARELSKEAERSKALLDKLKEKLTIDIDLIGLDPAVAKMTRLQDEYEKVLKALQEQQDKESSKVPHSLNLSLEDIAELEAKFDELRELAKEAVTKASNEIISDLVKKAQSKLDTLRSKAEDIDRRERDAKDDFNDRDIQDNVAITSTLAAEQFDKTQIAANREREKANKKREAEHKANREQRAKIFSQAKDINTALSKNVVLVKKATSAG